MDSAPWPLALPPGTEIDQYHIQKVLGKGGFGITYLAYDSVLQCSVALKELMPDGIATRAQGAVCALSETRREDFVWSKRNFLAEARHLARFDHPHIVQVRQVFESNGTAYMVMEYLRGPSLADHLERTGRPAREMVLAWMEALLDALGTVHRSGLIHGDVKPSNIILAEPDQRLVLLDFGTSRQSMQETATVTTMVSAGYAPFEQYLSRTKLTSSTDLYSLGATLYRAVAGSRPDEATARVGKTDPYVPLRGSSHEKIYGRNLCAVLDQALAVWPDDRPQSVDDFRRMYLKGLPAPNPKEQAPTEPSKRTSPPGSTTRKRAPALGLFVVFLVLLAGGVAATWYARDAQARRAVMEADIRNQVAEQLRQAATAPDLDQARRHLQAALDLDPSNREARDRLIEVERELERVAQSEAAKRIEAARRQTELESLLEDGNSALANGEWDRARRAFDDALQLSPGHPAALSGRDRAQAEINHLANARSEALRRRQQVDAACALGRKRQAEGDLNLAESAFQRALELDPSNPEALAGLQDVRAAMQNLAMAAAMAAAKSAEIESRRPPTPAASNRLIRGIEASSTLKPQTDKGQLFRYGSGNLIDGSTIQTWVEGVPGHGIGESFRVTFNQTVRLSRIQVYAGYGKNEEAYYKNSRVAEFSLRTSSGHQYSLRCADQMAYNIFTFDAPLEVDWLNFEIQRVHPGSKFDDTCVSEVIFE